MLKHEYFVFMELFANNYLIQSVDMSIQHRSHDRFELKRHSTCWVKTGTYSTLYQYLMDTSNMLDDVFTLSNLYLKELDR
jgi:hypothetical protein